MSLSSDLVDLSRSRVTLILNASSGRKDAEAHIEEIKARLEPAVSRLVIRPVRRGSEIASTARSAMRDGTDMIVVFGGDGTQSAVAGAIAGSNVVMAVLPGGTFNYFARELGVGETTDAALTTLLNGRVEHRDLGYVNGRIFINNASFGTYPEILERREAIYRRWGRSRLAAYWSVFVAMLELGDPMRLRITVKGETQEYDTAMAFVARSAYQLETLSLGGADAVRAGHFALFLAKRTSRLGLMAASLRLAFGRAQHGDDFDLIIADELLVETRRPRKLLAFDGEKAKMLGPFELKVLHGALRVVVPSGRQ